MQTTNTVLMIRPARFAFNPDTAANNRFQQAPLDPETASAKALEEFDGYVDTLRQHGVDVLVVQDTPEPHTPDSIFPNNCWSSHADGSLVLYPMEGENRRLERSKGVLGVLQERFAIQRTIDLSPLEQQNLFLEGTGSMVLTASTASATPATQGVPTNAPCASSPSSWTTGCACSTPWIASRHRSTTAT